MSLGDEDLRKSEDLEELVWDPSHGLSEKEIDQFQIIARLNPFSIVATTFDAHLY